MKYFTFSATLFFLTVVAAAGVCSSDQPALRKHVDAAGNFSFEFRGRWLAVNHSDYPNVASWFLVGGSKGDQEFVEAEVIVTRLKAEGAPRFDKYVELEQKLAERDKAIEAQAMPEMRYVDGRKAFRRRLSFDNPTTTGSSQRRCGVQYYIDGEDAIWGITIFTAGQDTRLISDIENTMLKSFRFLDGKKTPEVAELGGEPNASEIELFSDGVESGLEKPHDAEALTSAEGDEDAAAQRAVADDSVLNQATSSDQVSGTSEQLTDKIQPEEPESVSEIPARRPLWSPKRGND